MYFTEEAEEGLARIISAFGYPRPHLGAACDVLLSSLERSISLENLEFAIEDQLIASCFWHESLPGVANPLDEEQLTQSDQVLVNQLVGLFPYRHYLGFAGKPHRGCYLVDASETHRGAVFLQTGTDAGPTGPTAALFDSVEQHLAAVEEWREVRRRRIEVDDGLLSAEEWSELVDGYARRFPRMVGAVGELIHDALDGKGNVVQVPTQRASRCLEALQIADWIVQRLRGVVTEEPTGASSLIEGGTYDETYLPHLVLRPLARIASGDNSGGVTDAAELVRDGRGCALTQRWAKRIVDREGERLLEQ